MDVNPYQPPATESAAASSSRVERRFPWYQQYPLSSFLALAGEGAAVTACFAYGDVGAPGFVVLLLLSGAFLAFLRTGGISSAIIAVVFWWNLLFLGTLAVWWLGGWSPQSVSEAIASALRLLINASIAAVLLGPVHGVILGWRRGRWF
jgi:hypothetical protein